MENSEKRLYEIKAEMESCVQEMFDMIHKDEIKNEDMAYEVEMAACGFACMLDHLNVVLSSYTINVN